MPSDLLDRLQDNKLRAVDEFVQKCSSDPNGHSAALAEYIVEEGIGLRQDLERYWEFCWTKALKRQVDRNQKGAEIRAVLERGAEVLKRMAALGRHGSPNQIARLALFEEQAKAYPVWVEECMARWDALLGPPKPLDREQVARAQAAFARGECEDVAGLIARLEQGGSIS